MILVNDQNVQNIVLITNSEKAARLLFYPFILPFP